MHFNDFEVEGRAENFGRFAGEPKQGVHSDAVVGSEDDGDDSGRLFDGGDFFVGVAGCPDDERALATQAGVEHGLNDGVVGEVDDGVGGGDARGEVIAEIDGGGEGQGWIFFNGGEQGGAHAAFVTVDENAKRSGHEWLAGLEDAELR